MDIQLKNRFKVEIKSKSITDLLLNLNWDKYIQEISSVEKVINSDQFKINNFTLNYKSFFKYNDLTIKFLLLDTAIFDTLHAWCRKVFDDEGLGYYDDYSDYTMTITALNIDFTPNFTLTFYECYPKSVLLSPLSHENNSIYDMNVTFAFNRVELEKPNNITL